MQKQSSNRIRPRRRFAAADILPLENGGAEREFWPEAPGTFGERNGRKLEEKFCGKSICRNFAGIIPTSCRQYAAAGVGLARVLVNKPRVLPQDETFSSLNAQIRLMMRELLLDVWSEYRMSVPLLLGR